MELLVTAGDVPRLEGLVGGEVTFHTVFYLEGDASGGNLTPRLIGFADEQDRGFFQTFITVKGIGPRKALRALAVPASEVAAAIEAKDVKALIKLPQVGKRAAETIIAELAGKVGRFVGDAAMLPASEPTFVHRLAHTRRGRRRRCPCCSRRKTGGCRDVAVTRPHPRHVPNGCERADRRDAPPPWRALAEIPLPRGEHRPYDRSCAVS